MESIHANAQEMTISVTGINDGMAIDVLDID